MLGYQHHGDSHENFICYRVKESTKPGTLVPAACQKTIEPVSHRRDAENERGGKRRPGDRQIKDQYKEWDKDELGAYINKTDAAYVPSLGELAKLYYILNPYKGETFSPEGFSRPSGVYTSISESTEGRNYIMDFDTGLASGNVSKKTRLRLRMFYLF